MKIYPNGVWSAVKKPTWNSDLLLDIIHAFGIASQQHNEDIRQILGKILETAGN